MINSQWQPIKSTFGRSLILLIAAFGISNAQQRGQISGRVVAEDGAGMAGVTVQLLTYGARTGGSQTIITNADGNFQFNNLRPHSYALTAFAARGYVIAPQSATERAQRRYYRLGEQVVITMIKGGAISGRVTNADGAPLIGISVSASRVRDHENHKLTFPAGSRARQTDDRGIYRLYGLAPGAYIVVANSPSLSGLPIITSPYYGETPTYHPSATRDTAAEINVTSGGETSGIDIRYRGERGHAVSGQVTGGGSGTGNYGASVQLISVTAGSSFGSVFVRQSEGESGFAFYGVPDDEYELTAARFNPNQDDPSLRAHPRRVTVRGSDVSGVTLQLTAQAALNGRVIVAAAKPNHCARPNALTEAMVAVRRDERASNDPPNSLRPYLQTVAVNEQGEFTLRDLAPGNYRFDAHLPNEHWFLKSITVAVNAAGRRATAARPIGVADITRTGLTVQAGAQPAAVLVTLADNGASLRGRIVAAADDVKLPARLRVYLLPAEATAADDLLRYRETFARSDGQFTFSNVAPGRYLLLARPAPNDEAPDRPAAPAAWDNSARAQLRQQAAAAKIEMELRPCQQLKEQTIKHAPPTPRP